MKAWRRDRRLPLLRLRQASESSSSVSGTTLGASPKALSDAMVAI
jgi:hypothetical protein